MTGEEFGQKLLGELRRNHSETMGPLEDAIRKVLGIPEAQRPTSHIVPQLHVPPEFPQRRVKYDKAGVVVTSMVINSYAHFAEVCREQPEIVRWLPEPFQAVGG